MKDADLRIGATYEMVISGRRVPVRLIEEATWKGRSNSFRWMVENLVTGRRLCVRARRLRRELHAAAPTV